MKLDLSSSSKLFVGFLKFDILSMDFETWLEWTLEVKNLKFKFQLRFIVEVNSSSLSLKMKSEGDA